MSVLSEIGEFVRSIVEISKTVPADKLAILILGSIAIGALPAYFIGRMMRKKPDDGRPPWPPAEDKELLVW